MAIEAPDSPVIEEALSRISRLATLPEVVTRIMDLVDDPDASATDLESLVSGDPVLSTRVLKVVNSSFYGMPASVTSIQQAIVVLGMDALRNVVLAASLTKMFQGRVVQSEFDARGIWEHSTTVSAAAKLVAEQLGIKSGDFFIMGLLHDVGTLIQFQTMRKQFRELAEATRNSNADEFRAAEKRYIGATHEEFGLALCDKWNFPEPIKAAVGYHHNPGLLEGELRRAAQVIAVADSLASEAGHGFCCAAEPGCATASVAGLGLSDEALERIRAELPGHAEKAADIIGH